MDIYVILKCYAIGFLGNLTLGPIFILTFNSAAVYGWMYGVSACLGSTLADAILFALGVLGALSLIIRIKLAIELLYLVGALILFFIGIKSYRKDHYVALKSGHINGSESLVGIFIKSFLMTIANPLTIGYFAATSFAVFHDHLGSLPLNYVFVSSLIVASGTLSVLSLVSIIANYLGESISYKRLNQISKITGIIFILFGIYLLLMFLKGLKY